MVKGDEVADGKSASASDSLFTLVLKTLTLYLIAKRNSESSETRLLHFFAVRKMTTKILWSPSLPMAVRS